MMHVHFTGHLGKDPELRQAGETPVCKFSVASTERRKVGNDWQDVTDWVTVEVWGKKAEFCAKDLRRGAFVSVSGTLSTETWTDNQGKDRYTLKCKAADGGVTYPKQPGNDQSGDDRGRSGGRDERRPEPAKPAGRQAPKPAPPDDDVPF